MHSYFHKTEIDKEFYAKHIASSLPDRVIDAHAHFNLPEHVANVSRETVAGDWAMQCGYIMPVEDARYYASVLFPDRQIEFVALPFPLREADTGGNNAYISSLINKEGLRGLYTLRPEYGIDKVEREYTDGRFCGFKPYPYMASPVKGAEVSIFDFMTHGQFKLADRLGAPVLMHLPRAGRLPDPDNISEIRVILDRYPGVKLVIAHFGRCFNHEYFERALESLGDDVRRLWFDTSAVLNPKVYELAFRYLDYRRILYGTDMPVMLWHGKREWDAGGYHNLCREDFTWNTHKYPEDEKNYTFFIYEQINSILTLIGGDAEKTECVFCRNAEDIYVPRP
jgi:hypothetical protein